MNIIDKILFLIAYIINIFSLKEYIKKQQAYIITILISISLSLVMMDYYLELKNKKFDYIINADKQFIFKTQYQNLTQKIKICKENFTIDAAPRAFMFQYNNKYQQYSEFAWGFGFDDMKKDNKYNKRNSIAMTNQCKEYIINKISYQRGKLISKEEFYKQCPTISEEYIFAYSDIARNATKMLIVVNKDVDDGFKVGIVVGNNNLQNYECKFTTGISDLMEEINKSYSPFGN